MSVEGIFVAVGWIFVIALTLGTVAIIFTDIFKKLTSEQRAVFALVSPAVVGYVSAAKLLKFNEPMGILGVIGILYLIVPILFFYVQLKRISQEG